MAAYAGCVDSIDQNVGKLVSTLGAMGELENTLIFFLTDNGACQEGGTLGSGSEAEIRDHTKTNGTAGARCGRVWGERFQHAVSAVQALCSRRGMATPLIAHWPAGIPSSENGTFVNQIGYLPDFMPTCLELAGAEYPTEWNNVSVHAHSGASLVPILRGSDEPIHQEPLFWGARREPCPCGMEIGSWFGRTMVRGNCSILRKIGLR